MTTDETVLHHGECTQFTAQCSSTGAVTLRRYSCLPMQGSAFTIHLAPEEAEALAGWWMGHASAPDAPQAPAGPPQRSALVSHAALTPPLGQIIDHREEALAMRQAADASVVSMSLDDMATHLSAAGYLVRRPDESLEAMLPTIAAAHGYGLIPPNGPAPHDAWPPADHPVEPLLPAEELAARLTKVNARLNGQEYSDPAAGCLDLHGEAPEAAVRRLRAQPTNEDTIFTRAVKTWQHRHGQEIGKIAGAGATLKADLRSALLAACFYYLSENVETADYARHAAALEQAGLGSWFALGEAPEQVVVARHPLFQTPALPTENGSPATLPAWSWEDTVLGHCLAADKARQGVAVESEIRAILAAHYIEPHLAYATMARVLAQCEPERWQDTSGQAVQE